MAQDLFSNVLAKANIPNGVSVETVHLSRENHRLSVCLRAGERLSDVQCESLVRLLSDYLPGVSVGLDVRSDAAEAMAPATSQAKVTPRPAPSQKPAQAAASAPKQTADGVRILYGTSIKTHQRVRVHDLAEGDAMVVIEGVLVSAEMREGWKGKDGRTSYRVQLNVTDYTDSVYCVCTFYEEVKAQRFYDWVSPLAGQRDRLLVRGVCRMPRYAKELMVFVNDVNAEPAVYREDTAADKRVELHLHSRMSTMDGLTDLTEAFQMAKRWGHRALAITDHGVVQAFPEAAKAAKKTGVKAIFGVEGYLVPDCDLIDLQDTYVVFDIETTGLKPEHADILEIGAVKLSNGKIVDRFQTFINDGVLIPSNITRLTGITGDMLVGAPSSREALQEFAAFCAGCCLVAHNAAFDVGFIRHHGARYQIRFDEPYADTLMLSRYLVHDLPNHKLDTVCEYFAVDLTNHHRASDDAAATAEVFLRLLDIMHENGVCTIPVHRPEQAQDRESGKGRHKTNNTRSSVAGGNAGRHEEPVSTGKLRAPGLFSHPADDPAQPAGHVPGRADRRFACEQGELYQAPCTARPTRSLSGLPRSMTFWRSSRLATTRSWCGEGMVPDDEALRELNRKIVALGKRCGLPVVATATYTFLSRRTRNIARS